MAASGSMGQVAKPSLHKMDALAPALEIVDELGALDYPVLNISGASDVNGSDDLQYEPFLPEMDYGVFEQVDRIMSLYGIPLTIAIGCLGNTLSLIVFLCTHLRLQSSSVYLAFLNAVDTLFLLCLLIAWFGHVDIQLMNHEGVCQTVIFFSYVGGFLSVYTVAGFTVERWIIVFHPHYKNAWCTRRRAALVLSVLTVTSLVLYTFWFWSTGLVEIGGQRFCQPRPRFYTIVQVLSTVDSVITLLIPSTIIIVLNVSISKKVIEFAHKENERIADNGTVRLVTSPFLDHKHAVVGLQEMGSLCYVRRPSHAQCSSASTFSFRNLTVSKSGKPRGFRKRIQLRTTRSLLIVSTVFVSLNLPSHAFRIYAVIVDLGSDTYVFSKTSLLWQNLFQMIYYANFAANFFLYSACSRSFRQATCRLCTRVKHVIKARWNRRDSCCTART